MVPDRFRKPLRWAEYAITLFLIAVAVFGTVEYLSGTQPFYVVTDSPSSMSPTLNYGGVAVIFKAPFSSVGPGAIIAFHDPRGNPGTIVHRVVSAGSCGGARCLVTKGDNNATNPIVDPWNVTAGDYIGEAVLLVPYLGYISPALWGFSGSYALLPASVVLVAVAAAGVIERESGRKKKEGGQ